MSGHPKCPILCLLSLSNAWGELGTSEGIHKSQLLNWNGHGSRNPMT